LANAASQTQFPIWRRLQGHLQPRRGRARGTRNGLFTGWQTLPSHARRRYEGGCVSRLWRPECPAPSSGRNWSSRKYV